MKVQCVNADNSVYLHLMDVYEVVVNRKYFYTVLIDGVNMTYHKRHFILLDEEDQEE